MEREGKFLKAFIALLVLTIAIHSFIHFKILAGRISGFSIGEKEIGDNLERKANNKQINSTIFLALEWALLIGGFILIYSRYKTSIKKEYNEFKQLASKRYSGKITDLDKIHDFLKEKKEVRISTIAKAFDVDENLAESWAKTLTQGGIAKIKYPRIGGAKIKLAE